MSLNDQIIYWLQSQGIASRDFQTGQVEGQPEEILFWGSDLGPEPTAGQLQGAYTAQQLSAAQAAQVAGLWAAYLSAIAAETAYTSKAGVAKTYQADAGSISNLSAMLNAFSGAQATPSGFYWVAADNTQVPFTYADLQGLAAAIGAQGWAAYQHYQVQKAAVLAATTAAAVQAVTW